MSHEISHTYKEKGFYDILSVKALKNRLHRKRLQ